MENQENQYARSLIEASLDPLVTINIDGKIMDMNHATINITGLTRKELTNSDFFDYFTEPQKAREVYQEVFANGSVADSPLTLRHKKGKLTDVLFNGSIYKDEKEKVLGVVIVARDVTDQKIISNQLNEAKAFAELATKIAEEAQIKAEGATRIAVDSVKAKQQFLSNMSHEIRTPMNAIIGFTKVVLKTELSSKQREYLQAIKTSGDALIVLINDILDLAKVDSGKMSFEKVPFKMEKSIAAMIHVFDIKSQEKNVKLLKEYDLSIPEVVVGDPVRLHQIILNLVSNAVKFTSKGKIIVSVKLVEESDKEVIIEFAVSDTGIGILENKMQTIFENFQQASSGTSRIYGGTGLGLAIVKQLVEGQKGSIKVQSTIGQGSIFSFRLPFLKTNSEAQIIEEIITLDDDIKNIKVLVVEDITLNQLLMRTLLDDFGFTCDIASNGQIAIDKLQTDTYDIILMDLQMPIMNGFEATEYIRSTLNLNVPIVALTADVTTVDIDKCKAVGMNDYLSKPVDERLLYSKIISLLKKVYQTKQEEIKSILEVKTRCIDLNYLMKRTKSNPELMSEMISLYLEQTPPLITAMRQSFDKKDWTTLYATVHKMIPSFSIVGIHQDFETMAKKIQDFAGKQSEVESIPEMVLQLENICVQACRELEEELIIIKKMK
jgi:PAS domain S-box-containing protein